MQSDEIVTLVERRKAVSSRHLCISRHIFLSQRICSHKQGNYWATRVRFRLGTPLVTHTTQNDVNTAPKPVLGTSVWILERHVLARYCSNFCPQIDPIQNLWFWSPIKSRAVFFVFFSDPILWTKRAHCITDFQPHLIAFPGIRCEGSALAMKNHQLPPLHWRTSTRLFTTSLW